MRGYNKRDVKAVVLESSSQPKALSAVVIEEMDGGSCEEGFITVRVRLLFPRMPLYERSFQSRQGNPIYLKYDFCRRRTSAKTLGKTARIRLSRNMFSKFQTSHLRENLSFAAEQQSHILQSMNSREPQGQDPHRILPGPESETIPDGNYIPRLLPYDERWFENKKKEQVWLCMVTHPCA